MEKQILVTVAFISTIIISTVAGTQLVDFARANPFPFPIGENVPPDASTKPPIITVVSPQNNSAYNSTNLTLSFTAKVQTSSAAIGEKINFVSYKASWQANEEILYENTDRVYIADGELSSAYTEYSCNLSIIEVPEGRHNFTISVIESGFYLNSAVFNPFKIANAFSVFFAVDLTPPLVTVLSMENKTYNESDVSMYFTVNEPVSQVTYSLDGQENVTISGNTTLTGLANRDHSLIVYAKDEAGNIGTSKTITFTVAESFPTTLVATTSVVTVAVVGAVILIYFKRRRHQAEEFSKKVGT